MTRTYIKAKRAEAQEETRERIVAATMDLHLAQGVAVTSYADVAARAGVGAATVYRHFPTMGALVEACGAHFWEAIEPPRPADAPAVFAGLRSRAARLERLVRELDAFYARAEGPLWSAMRDEDRVPELARFLHAVGAGVNALVGSALGEQSPGSEVTAVAAVADFAVWRALSQQGIAGENRISLMMAILEAALSAGPADAAGQRGARAVNRGRQ